MGEVQKNYCKKLNQTALLYGNRRIDRWKRRTKVAVQPGPLISDISRAQPDNVKKSQVKTSPHISCARHGSGREKVEGVSGKNDAAKKKTHLFLVARGTSGGRDGFRGGPWWKQAKKAFLLVRGSTSASAEVSAAGSKGRASTSSRRRIGVGIGCSRKKGKVLH